ncbi:putative ATP-grasp-modified RiPP [Kitasatospora sp. NBC_01302]|uniref:putative ATP-grasp-modified RiPP n=1 Tax=Kitasatospora sp. NBC_01302 TaxID=2903575 RepID=UPI002E108DF3|nr:putative ATP-grasp-modified RiPP [Kitasatospora sp. NBC_01302]
MTTAPWGTTRMGPYAESSPIPALTPLIDPETQIAVIVDEHGRTVELGAHGTSTNTSTPTNTGGGDGQGGGQNTPTDMDSIPANDQDQGTG